MDENRKRETLKAIDNQTPLTWRGSMMALGTVALLGVGIHSLIRGETRDALLMLGFGLFGALFTAWCFHSARALRRSDRDQPGPAGTGRGLDGRGRGARESGR